MALPRNRENADNAWLIKLEKEGATCASCMHKDKYLCPAVREYGFTLGSGPICDLYTRMQDNTYHGE